MHNSLSQANTMQFTGVNPVLAGPVLASSLTSSDDNSGLRKSSSPTSQRKLLENDNTTDSDVNRHCFKSPSNKVHSMGTENKENNGSETDFSDGDDSTDHKSSSGDNSSGDDGEILSRMELGIVTSRDIFFQEQLLKAMKSKHASQIKAKNESNKTIPIEEHYYKPRNPDEKVEISENSGFYLSRVRASIIETNAVCRN
ncbi:GSCOCG00012512001-RA-CDS, partial [Cotesia congregata]